MALNYSVMYKFRITEKQEDDIIGRLLTESFHPKSGMVRKVKTFLDKNFEKSYVQDFNDKGYPSRTKKFVWVDKTGTPLKTMSRNEMLLMLDDKFNNLLKNDSERRALLKQILDDWYDSKITKEGILTKNTIY